MVSLLVLNQELQQKLNPFVPCHGRGVLLKGQAEIGRMLYKKSGGELDFLHPLITA